MLALIRNVGFKRNLRSNTKKHNRNFSNDNNEDTDPKQIAENIVNDNEIKTTKRIIVDEQDPKKIARDMVKSFPEAPTTCCMTGCANCVWLDYAEKLADYYKDGGEKALKEIEEQIDDGNMRAFIMHEIRMRLKK